MAALTLRSVASAELRWHYCNNCGCQAILYTDLTSSTLRCTCLWPREIFSVTRTRDWTETIGHVRLRKRAYWTPYPQWHVTVVDMR